MKRDSARRAAATGLVAFCLAARFACGSTDHTDRARSVLEDSDFGQPYKVAAATEDPANPGSYSVDLTFEHSVDL